MTEAKLEPGQTVLVEAKITSVGNTICGICLHGYENSKRLVEVIKEHVHPFTGVQEWRPIESAPKDGTQILTLRHESYQAVAEWDQERKVWRMIHGPDIVGVTHWLPLPPPPSSAEQGEGG